MPAARSAREMGIPGGVASWESKGAAIRNPFEVFAEWLASFFGEPEAAPGGLPAIRGRALRLVREYSGEWDLHDEAGPLTFRALRKADYPGLVAHACPEDRPDRSEVRVHEGKAPDLGYRLSKGEATLDETPHGPALLVLASESKGSGTRYRAGRTDALPSRWDNSRFHTWIFVDPDARTFGVIEVQVTFVMDYEGK